MKSSIVNFEVKGEVGEAEELGWRAWPADAAELKADLRAIKGLRVSEKVWTKGTPFQRSVWKACLAIPEGAVVTYSDIALAIGRPAAVRAVAQALGRNPVGVRIPCHRVIGQGSLGGYSCPFGLKAKLEILRAEGH